MDTLRSIFEPPAGLSGLPAREPPTSDGQLQCLLHNFAEQCGAAFAFLIGFMAPGEPHGHVLASWQAQCGSDSIARDEIAAAVCSESALRTGARSLQRQFLKADGRRYQLSSLHFSPASGVEIVAVCARRQMSPVVLQNLAASSLHPILECCLRLWWMHSTEKRRASAFRQALELTDLGIVLLDRRCSVLFANHCAEALFDQSDGLQLRGTLLGCSHPAEVVRLQSVLKHSILANRISSDPDGPRQPGRMIALRRKSRRPLILTLLNIDRPAVADDDPAVILYVLDPEHDVRKMLAPVYRLYQLTAMEARLASELVCGSSLADATAAIKVRPYTARGYLKQIFAKTETNRQADLIRLMLASATRSSAGMDLSLL